MEPGPGCAMLRFAHHRFIAGQGTTRRMESRSLDRGGSADRCHALALPLAPSRVQSKHAHTGFGRGTSIDFGRRRKPRHPEHSTHPRAGKMEHSSALASATRFPGHEQCRLDGLQPLWALASRLRTTLWPPGQGWIRFLAGCSAPR